MATLALVISLAALLASSSAQSEDSNEIVWSSVAYVLYGDRPPLRSSSTGSPALTPLGAEQLYQQGSMFRARYLSPTINYTEEVASVTSHATINGIETNAIDNTQLWVASSTDDYTVGSAYAFMQGLYPPRNQSFSDNAGGTDGAILADGTLTDYPLSGYQYPTVQTLSILDPTAIWIEGNVACSSYQESILQYRNDTNVQTLYNNTLQLYQQMWAKIFAGVFTLTMANFHYAYDLYDYAQFQWTHDEAIRDVMTEGDLALLREFASVQQRDLNGNLSASGLVEGDMIRAVAGRTLAGKVVTQLKANMLSSGKGEKLSLMFGSFEPFVAFFALSDLVNGPSAGVFNTLPSPGAAMIWELFSVGQNATTYPSDEDLWVRFLYRNSTDSDARFTEYAIFGNGNSQSSMRWVDFQTQMEKISVDTIKGWCQTCDSVNLYCPTLIGNGNTGSTSVTGSRNSYRLSPAVAGVIGAITAIAVLGLAVTTAAVFGGVRIYRADPKRRNSTLGGFKGAEKMASDTDLAVAKGGARHERTGSWELRDGNQRPDSTASAGAVVSKDFVQTRTKDVDDDAISEMNATPVKPREEV